MLYFPFMLNRLYLSTAPVALLCLRPHRASARSVVHLLHLPWLLMASCVWSFPCCSSDPVNLQLRTELLLFVHAGAGLSRRFWSKVIQKVQINAEREQKVSLVQDEVGLILIHRGTRAAACRREARSSGPMPERLVRVNAERAGTERRWSGRDKRTLHTKTVLLPSFAH